jgi:ribose/xylose/arabinose/galactoside ABC-type transport system permease subunit
VAADPGQQSAPGGSDRRAGAFDRVGRLLLGSEYLVLLLGAVLFLTLLPFAPGLTSRGNLQDLTANVLPLLVVALGQTVVLIAGGIDLSQTSTIALSSVVGGLIMNGDSGWLKDHPLAAPLAILAMLAVGAVIGLVNGWAITRLRMPAFMVTLTSMMFLSGLAIWITQSRNLDQLPEGFVMLGARLVPALLLVTLVFGFLQLLLTRSLVGRWLYALGQNPHAAEVAGVPVRGVTIAAYCVSGLLAAVASILYTGRLETASPVHGQRILLDVIGATVLGGTSLFGGKGKLLWTTYGVLFLGLLDNGLNLVGHSHFTIMMIKGGVIVLAAALDVARNRWRSLSA